MSFKEENEILKQLVKNGFFWINYSSTDCDGCTSERAIKFTDLDEYYKYREEAYEGAEGSMYFNLARQYPDGSFSLNEETSGGQWKY